MSDNFNLGNENNFNLFSNLKVPDDFLQTLTNAPINQNEQKKDYFSDMFAIQNYNVSNSKVTSPGNSTIKYFEYGFGSNQNFPPVIQDMVPIQENEQQENQDYNGFQRVLNDSLTQNMFPYEDEIIQKDFDQHSSNSQSPQQFDQLQAPLQSNANFENSKNPDHFLYNENLFAKKKLAINPNTNDQIASPIQQQQLLIDQNQAQFSQQANYYMMPNQISQQQQFLYQQQQQQYSAHKKGPIIVDESKQRYTGKLKFFDEQKSYGFIVKDDDNSDVFVHFDDFTKAGISQEVLQTIRAGKTIRFEFCCLGYMGKYARSRKAIDLVIISVE